MLDTLHVDLVRSGLAAASNGANVVAVCSTFVNMQKIISSCQRSTRRKAKKKTNSQYFKSRCRTRSYRYDFR